MLKRVLCRYLRRCVQQKLHKFLLKFWYKARLVAHNGIFLFVRSVLTVRVMYWARVEDYFYPFHEVCMHLLYRTEAASQSAQKIIVRENFGCL